MKKKTVLLALAFFTALGLSLTTPITILADEGIKKEKVQAEMFNLQDGFKLLSPIKNDLSGRAALLAEGKESPFRAPQSQGGVGGSVPYRNPAPAFSRNVLLSRDFGTPIHTEPHIAVNPKDPKHIVVAEIDYAQRYNPAYVSFDGGENWRGPVRVPLAQDIFSAGDPVVAFDRGGNVYQGFMAIGEKSYDLGLNFPLDIPTSDIAVSSSKDGGLHWLSPVAAAQNGFVYEFGKWPDGSTRLKSFEFSFLDKPWMDIGPNPEDLGKDIIYVSYTAFSQTYLVDYFGALIFFTPVRFESVIKAAASKDSGLTWSDHREVSPRRTIFELGKQRDGAIKTWVVQGSQPKVAKDGTAHIAWYDSADDDSSKGKGHIYISQSKDGGDVWSKPALAAEFLEVSRSPHSVPFRNSSSFPQIALGANGEVHIVYGAVPEDKKTDEGDIYFVSSQDGKVFTKPVRLNQDKTQNIQFFPAVAADPTGNLHVMWGDTRDDPKGLEYHMYYTRSLDRGKSWGFELKDLNVKEPDTRVTDFPSNPNDGFPRGRFIGDYFAIAAGSEQDVYMVWADTRLGKYGPMSQKIGFARREAMPSPEIFLNPARGPAGQEVKIQAFNFQPDMDIFIRLGGKITAAGRTNEDGRLTYKAFMPIASEGTHDVTVFDESGNAAPGSFYMDFGFSDLKQKGSDKKPIQEKDERPPVLEKQPASATASSNAAHALIGLLAVLALGLLFTLIITVIRQPNRRSS